MSSPIPKTADTSVRVTFIAAYLAVTLAQITNAFPGALNGQFAAEFHPTGAGLTWISSVFVIAIVVFELTFGVLGDMFGRKKLLYAGGALHLRRPAHRRIRDDDRGDDPRPGRRRHRGRHPLSHLPLHDRGDHAGPAGRARVIATWAGFLSLGAVISPVSRGSPPSCSPCRVLSRATPNVFSGWRVAYYVRGRRRRRPVSS